MTAVGGAAAPRRGEAIRILCLHHDDLSGDAADIRRLGLSRLEALLRDGADGAAMALAERLRVAFPDDPAVAAAALSALRRSGDPMSAGRAAAEAAARWPDHAGLARECEECCAGLLQAALGHANQDRRAEAAALLPLAWRLAPGHGDALALEALLALRDGALERALELCDEALARPPLVIDLARLAESFAAEACTRLIARLKQGESTTLIPLCQRLLALAPRAEVAALTGLAAAEAADDLAARRYFAQALASLDAQHVPRLVRLRLEVGETAEAVVLYRNWSGRDGQAVAVADLAAWCAAAGHPCRPLAGQTGLLEGTPGMEPLRPDAAPPGYIATLPAMTVVTGTVQAANFHYLLAKPEATVFLDGLSLQPHYHALSEATFLRCLSLRGWRAIADFAGHDRRPELPGTSLLIGGSDNYFHFLLEWLPRVAGLSAADIAAADHILVNHPLRPWHRQAFAWAGLPLERLVALPGPSLQPCQRLIVPSVRSGADAIAFLRDRLLPAALAGAPLSTGRAGRRRLFISRRDSPFPRLAAETALAESLRGLGFETVVLGGMDLAEQIRLFATAECVVAGHGAGLANVAFAPHDCRVLELASRANKGFGFFESLCRLRRLPYCRLADERPLAEGERAGLNENAVIDPARLRRAVLAMLGNGVET